ncbi:MAG: ABC transporter permease, partial [Spirochaetales bacterium]|nr:ABC transporter permease [Spirochaetales bacterium]
MILLIAIRNLIRNIRNTILILILIMFIITLFFIGNSVLTGSEKRLMESYTGSFTGDVVIKARSETSISLFGSNTPAIGEFISIPVLEHYDEIISILEQDKRVELLSSQVSGIAVLDIYGRRYNVPLFGIDAGSYFPLFNEIEIVEGSMLIPGQRGAMISKNRALRIEEETGKKPVPGTPLLFSTLGRSGFKIRELLLAAIYTYSKSTPVMDEIILTDPQTLRALNSIMLASDSDYIPPEEVTDLISDDLNLLFDIESSSEKIVDHGNVSLLEELTIQFSPANIDSSDNKSTDWKGGSWNFILIKLKEGVSSRAFIKDLNILLPSCSAEAVDWRQAAGKSALLVLLLMTAFNGGLFLVGIAGIIAVANILLISVFR